MIGRRKFLQAIFPASIALAAAAALPKLPAPAAPTTDRMVPAKARAELGITDPCHSHTINDPGHCHGWTDAAGRYHWIGDRDLEGITGTL